MEIQQIQANPKIEADRDRLVLQRGPVMYCLEWPDNHEGKVSNLALDTNAALRSAYKSNLLGGVVIIRGKAILVSETGNHNKTDKPVDFTAIPYFSWANRGSGEMVVWLME
jgi:hypothetical protein